MQKIMFNDRYGLTQAVLNGTKTMTRRVINELCGLSYAVGMMQSQNADIEIINEKFARYKLGETVAVAQAYKDVVSENDLAIFDDGLETKLSKGWSNKMFVKSSLMPHQIQITDIKFERLQDITDEDCLKEGVIKHSDSRGNFYYYVKGVDGWFYSPREAFAALINRPGVGRKGLWEENPFVMVYEFKLLK